MNVIPVSKDEVLEDFPVVNNWLSGINSFLNKDINDKKIEFFYSFGFFLPKVKDKDSFYLKMYEDCANMKFEDRLSFEMSKVRVNLTIKSGNFMLSDRLPKGRVPELIANIVSEITKVKMIIESEYHENKDVIDSIPDLNRDIVSFEMIKDFVKDDMSVHQFDLDSILDKISTGGYDSLSDEEKDYLDKKSKDM